MEVSWSCKLPISANIEVEDEWSPWEMAQMASVGLMIDSWSALGFYEALGLQNKLFPSISYKKFSSIT